METFAEEAGKDELNIIGIYTNLEASEGDAEPSDRIARIQFREGIAAENEKG